MIASWKEHRPVLVRRVIHILLNFISKNQTTLDEEKNTYHDRQAKHDVQDTVNAAMM
jgi:hypothetical protein